MSYLVEPQSSETNLKHLKQVNNEISLYYNIIHKIYKYAPNNRYT